MSYIVFAHLPDADEIVPRHNGPEITTQLLRHGFNWMHAETSDTNFTPQSGGYFSTDDDPFEIGADDSAPSTTADNESIAKAVPEPFPSNFDLILGSGQRIVADGRSMSFMRIGHVAWALLLGWIGGHFTQTVYEWTRRDRTTAMHRSCESVST